MENITTNFGALNIVWGWCWMVLGILSGSLLGMWSFAGPMPTPKGHEDYANLPRRLVRLAHIAFFMLPLICVAYGMFIDKAVLSEQMKQIGSICMIICMIGVPLLLIAASFKIIFKYFEAIPVTAGIIALMIMAYGQYQYYLTL